jgi:hypothetical protein
MSVALQIRDVPEQVRDQLAAQARAKGQSLQAYLLDLITEEVRRGRNLAILARFDGRADGTTDEAGTTAAEIGAMRAERDRQLDGTG